MSNSFDPTPAELYDPGIDTPAVDLAAIRNLVNNAWDWGILEFCDALGEAYDRLHGPDLHTMEQFRHLQEAAGALQQFDEDTMKIICTRKTT